MCQFISTEHVMPGYICCSCRSYNGLQRMALPMGEGPRLTHCKNGCTIQHRVEVPADVPRCASCGAGYDRNPDGSVNFPKGNAAGTYFPPNACFVCGANPFREAVAA